MTREAYLSNPCRAASVPYWKAQSITVPPFMKILHEEEYNPAAFTGYTDEPYFRLLHPLTDIPPVTLPEGFTFSTAAPEEFSAHIAACYEHIGISPDELRRWTEHSVYHPGLWLVIRSADSGEIAASGIGEMDRETGEGVLEWIQVSPAYRRLGLGRSIVLALLHRMAEDAGFATVSGQCRNPSKPELLYRACGFTGHDVWHILHKHEPTEEHHAIPEQP